LHFERSSNLTKTSRIGEVIDRTRLRASRLSPRRMLSRPQVPYSSGLSKSVTQSRCNAKNSPLQTPHSLASRPADFRDSGALSIQRCTAEAVRDRGMQGGPGPGMSGGQMGSTAQPPATLRDGPTCTGQRGLLGAG